MNRGIALVTLLATIFVAPVFAAEIQLANDTLIRNALFKGGTLLVTDQFTRLPIKGTLAQYLSSNQLVIGPGEVRFTSEMQVLSGICGTANKYNTVELKKDSLLTFYPGGALRTSTVASQADAANNFKIAADSSIFFHENGSIAEAKSSMPWQFSIPQNGASFSAAAGVARFFPGARATNNIVMGNVEMAVLAVDHVENDTVLPANSTVTFDWNGTIRGISSATPFTFRSIILAGGGLVQVDPEGIMKIFSYQPVTIAGKSYPANQPIFVSANGLVVGVPPT